MRKGTDGQYNVARVPLSYEQLSNKIKLIWILLISVAGFALCVAICFGVSLIFLQNSHKNDVDALQLIYKEVVRHENLQAAYATLEATACVDSMSDIADESLSRIQSNIYDYAAAICDYQSFNVSDCMNIFYNDKYNSDIEDLKNGITYKQSFYDALTAYAAFSSVADICTNKNSIDNIANNLSYASNYSDILSSVATSIEKKQALKNYKAISVTWSIIVALIAPIVGIPFVKFNESVEKAYKSAEFMKAKGSEMSTFRLENVIQSSSSVLQDRLVSRLAILQGLLSLLQSSQIPGYVEHLLNVSEQNLAALDRIASTLAMYLRVEAHEDPLTLKRCDLRSLFEGAAAAFSEGVSVEDGLASDIIDTDSSLSPIELLLGVVKRAKKDVPMRERRVVVTAAPNVPTICLADRDKLKALVLNAISGAMGVSRGKIRVHLSVLATEKPSEWAKVSLDDGEDKFSAAVALKLGPATSVDVPLQPRMNFQKDMDIIKNIYLLRVQVRVDRLLDTEPLNDEAFEFADDIQIDDEDALLEEFSKSIPAPGGSGNYELGRGNNYVLGNGDADSTENVKITNVYKSNGRSRNNSSGGALDFRPNLSRNSSPFAVDTRNTNGNGINSRFSTAANEVIATNRLTMQRRPTTLSQVLMSNSPSHGKHTIAPTGRNSVYVSDGVGGNVKMPRASMAMTVLTANSSARHQQLFGNRDPVSVIGDMAKRFAQGNTFVKVGPQQLGTSSGCLYSLFMIGKLSHILGGDARFRESNFFRPHPIISRPLIKKQTFDNSLNSDPTQNQSNTGNTGISADQSGNQYNNHKALHSSRGTQKAVSRQWGIYERLDEVDEPRTLFDKCCCLLPQSSRISVERASARIALLRNARDTDGLIPVHYKETKILSHKSEYNAVLARIIKNPNSHGNTGVGDDATTTDFKTIPDNYDNDDNTKYHKKQRDERKSRNGKKISRPARIMPVLDDDAIERGYISSPHRDKNKAKSGSRLNPLNYYNRNKNKAELPILRKKANTLLSSLSKKGKKIPQETQAGIQDFEDSTLVCDFTFTVTGRHAVSDLHPAIAHAIGNGRSFYFIGAGLTEATARTCAQIADAGGFRFCHMQMIDMAINAITTESAADAETGFKEECVCVLLGAYGDSRPIKDLMSLFWTLRKNLICVYVAAAEDPTPFAGNDLTTSAANALFENLDDLTANRPSASPHSPSNAMSSRAGSMTAQSTSMQTVQKLPDELLHHPNFAMLSEPVSSKAVLKVIAMGIENNIIIDTNNKMNSTNSQLTKSVPWGDVHAPSTRGLSPAQQRVSDVRSVSDAGSYPDNDHLLVRNKNNNNNFMNYYNSNNMINREGGGGLKNAFDENNRRHGNRADQSRSYPRPNSPNGANKRMLPVGMGSQFKSSNTVNNNDYNNNDNGKNYFPQTFSKTNNHNNTRLNNPSRNDKHPSNPQRSMLNNNGLHNNFSKKNPQLANNNNKGGLNKKATQSKAALTGLSVGVSAQRLSVQFKQQLRALGSIDAHDWLPFMPALEMLNQKRLVHEEEPVNDELIARFFLGVRSVPPYARAALYCVLAAMNESAFCASPEDILTSAFNRASRFWWKGESEMPLFDLTKLRQYLKSKRMGTCPEFYSSDILRKPLSTSFFNTAGYNNNNNNINMAVNSSTRFSVMQPNFIPLDFHSAVRVISEIAPRKSMLRRPGQQAALLQFAASSVLNTITIANDSAGEILPDSSARRAVNFSPDSGNLLPNSRSSLVNIRSSLLADATSNRSLIALRENKQRKASFKAGIGFRGALIECHNFEITDEKYEREVLTAAVTALSPKRTIEVIESDYPQTGPYSHRISHFNNNNGVFGGTMLQGQSSHLKPLEVNDEMEYNHKARQNSLSRSSNDDDAGSLHSDSVSSVASDESIVDILPINLDQEYIISQRILTSYARDGRRAALFAEISGEGDNCSEYPPLSSSHLIGGNYYIKNRLCMPTIVPGQSSASRGNAAYAEYPNPLAKGIPLSTINALIRLNTPLCKLPREPLDAISADFPLSSRQFGATEIASWDFDVLELDEFELASIAETLLLDVLDCNGGHILAFDRGGPVNTQFGGRMTNAFASTVSMAHSNTGIENFSCSERFQLNSLYSKIRNFVLTVKTNHNDNIFRNFAHSMMVAQVVSCLYRIPQLFDFLGYYSRLALTIAAVGVHLDHPGVNATFLTSIQSFTATLYSDRSVLENHRCSLMFEILRAPEKNILAELSVRGASEVRKKVANALIFSDICYNQSFVADLDQLVQRLREIKAIDLEGRRTPSSQQLMDAQCNDQSLERILLRVSEVSEPLLNTPMYKRWAGFLSKETQILNLINEAFGFESHNSDNSPEYSIHILYIGGIVKPLVDSLATVFPEALNTRIALLKTNVSCWRSVKAPSARNPPSGNSRGVVPAGKENEDAAAAQNNNSGQHAQSNTNGGSGIILQQPQASRSISPSAFGFSNSRR